MADKAFRFGPGALTTTLTTNLLNPPAASGGVNAGVSGQQILLSQIRVVNRGASPEAFYLWLGASGGNAAGTEIGSATVPAFGYVDLNYGYPGLKLDTSDFLVGGASANSALTIEGVGVIRVAG